MTGSVWGSLVKGKRCIFWKCIMRERHILLGKTSGIQHDGKNTYGCVGAGGAAQDTQHPVSPGSAAFVLAPHPSLLLAILCTTNYTYSLSTFFMGIPRKIKITLLQADFSLIDSLQRRTKNFQPVFSLGLFKLCAFSYQLQLCALVSIWWMSLLL